MLDYNDIEMEIQKLESLPQTYATLGKLSTLYTVLNNRRESHKVERTAEPIVIGSTTDFGKLLTSRPMEQWLPILEEHMESIRIVYPKEYDVIMRRISSV